MVQLDKDIPDIQVKMLPLNTNQSEKVVFQFCQVLQNSKKSPKVDIRKLVDSVKHVIEANQKESLYVNNINYENINENANQRKFLSKEKNVTNKPTTKLIETKEINETNGANHTLSLKNLQDESQIKEIPKIKNIPYTEKKALDTSEQEELKSCRLKLKMPRRSFILFNPQK